MNNSSTNAFLLHVSSTESREIHSFFMDPEAGSLKSIESILVPGSGEPTRGNLPLLWGNNKRVLYAHVRIAPYPISAFLLDVDSGAMKLMGTVSMPAPMAYLSTSLDGRFLLGASYDGALITVNSISTDGSLSPKPQQILTTPPKTHCIITAPFGGFVYATSVDGDVILVYRFNESTGLLDEVEDLKIETKAGAGPRHLVFHPTLDVLYCINEHDGSLVVYGVDRMSGRLHDLQSVSLVPNTFMGNALASDVHITPNGKYLYASVRKVNTISAFHINPITGLLTEIAVYDVEPNPRGFAIDPSGNFLVAAGQETNHIAVYRIDIASGRLGFLDRYQVGKRPSWIVIIEAPHIF